MDNKHGVSVQVVGLEIVDDERGVYVLLTR